MLIENRNRNQNSSLQYLVGKELGEVLSQVTSASISQGNYLERLFENTSKSITWRKRVDVGEKKKICPDFLIFQDDNVVCIGEIKMGTTFDTKKSKAEIQNLKKLKSYYKKQGYDVRLLFVSFQAKDKDEIKRGLKGNMNSGVELFTGKEFSDFLGVSYDSIIESLSKNIRQNVKYLHEKITLVYEEMYGKA